MANPKKRVSENVPGDFFVDSTCIDCDACRQIAPSVFGKAAETSFVKAQPVASTDRRRALQALLACPTGSIGCLADDDVKAVMKDFPLVIEEPVYYCGYNSPKSYGGNSYLIRHADGNWLVDSPKFVTSLVRQLDTLGGIAHIFLTHRDDVADAERYAKHFGSRRIIHRDELSSQPGAETVLDGEGPWELAPGFLAIPTPGHTEGHCVLLFQEKFLFTGDHLSWSRDRKQLSASEDYCWYSWPRQAESMARLADYPVSSGSCLATARRFICPPPRCDRRSSAWQGRCVKATTMFQLHKVRIKVVDDRQVKRFPHVFQPFPKAQVACTAHRRQLAAKLVLTANLQVINVDQRHPFQEGERFLTSLKKLVSCLEGLTDQASN